MTETIRLRNKANVGFAVRHYRHVHGVTQAQLAELLGVSRAYISRVENGEFADHFGRWIRAFHLMGMELVLQTETASPEERESSEQIQPG
jgi:transcriptional regulator with XRE-family HTH domain